LDFWGEGKWEKEGEGKKEGVKQGRGWLVRFGEKVAFWH